MEFEFRELSTPDDLEELISLQAIVGGLPPKDTMSPITLTAMTIKHPRVGWVLGAFHDEEMVAFSTGFATAEPHTAFGHMLGVLNEYRNSKVGFRLLQFGHDLYKKSGIQRVCWTFEPLESPNAHLYLNNMGGRCIRYLKAHYYLDVGLHHGMPQDRFLIELDLYHNHDRGPEPDSVQQALDRYPVAAENEMVSAEAVLVEIPGNLRLLQDRDPAAALAWRMSTRVIFEEYLNNRGMAAVKLFSDIEDGRRRSYLLLRRE